MSKFIKLIKNRKIMLLIIPVIILTIGIVVVNFNKKEIQKEEVLIKNNNYKESIYTPSRHYVIHDNFYNRDIEGVVEYTNSDGTYKEPQEICNALRYNVESIAHNYVHENNLNNKILYPEIHIDYLECPTFNGNSADGIGSTISINKPITGFIDVHSNINIIPVDERGNEFDFEHNDFYARETVNYNTKISDLVNYKEFKHEFLGKRDYLHDYKMVIGNRTYSPSMPLGEIVRLESDSNEIKVYITAEPKKLDFTVGNIPIQLDELFKIGDRITHKDHLLSFVRNGCEGHIPNEIQYFNDLNDQHLLEGYKFSKINFRKRKYDCDMFFNEIIDKYVNIYDMDNGFSADLEPMKYQVSFDSNGGSSVNGIEVTFDSPYGTLPTPTREGYDFGGWYTSKDGGTLITSETYYKTPYDYELYAHWSKKQYNITFDANNSDNDKTVKTIEYDTKIGSLIPNFDNYNPGYSFDGFYTEKENGLKITSETVYKTVGNATYYAHWTPNTYNVKFNPQGGNVSTNSSAVTFKTIYGTLPSATRDEYDFVGWFDRPSGGNLINSNSVVNIPNDHELYAHWKKETIDENSSKIKIDNFGDKKKVGDYLTDSKDVEKIYDKDEKEKSSDSLIVTGDIIIKKGKRYRMIIKGDLTGKGYISSLDFVKLWNHLDRNNNKKIDNDLFLSAADMNADENVSSLDYVIMWNMLKRS